MGRQYISTYGKEVLIKAVAMALLPTYTMSCFKLPVSLCKELERFIATFWWKGKKQQTKIHWIAWKIAELKKNRGLRFRDLARFNLAMLAKVWWTILHSPDSLLKT